MAALVIAAAGSVIGGAIAPGIVAFGLTGSAIGYMAGSLLASALVGGSNSQGPRLDSLRVQGTEYGQAIPWVFGAPRLAGQVVWASERQEIANTQKVGKGGGSKVTTYTYEVDLLVVLTENPTIGVSREWLNGTLVYNGVVVEGTWSGITIYTGEAGQLPDPTYEAAVGVGRAPAFRGRTSIMIRGLQLGSSGQIGNLTSEIGISGAIPNDIGFLNQFETANTVLGEPGVVSRVGPDLKRASSLSGVGAIVSDARFNNGALRLTSGGNSAAQYTTNANEINFDFGGNDWRFEGWWKWENPTDADINVFGRPGIAGIYVSNGLFIEFSPGGSFTAFNLQFALAGASGGGGLGSAGFIAPGTYRHWAIQQDSTARIISLHFNGLFMGSYSYSITDPPLYGVNGRVAFFGPAANSPMQSFFDSTVLKTLLPGEAYPLSGAYTIPSEPFTLESGIATPWYDSPLDPNGLRSAVNQLLARSGYSESQYDASALAGIPLYAYTTGNQVANTRAHLETLRTYGKYEASKSDKIYIRPRATVSVASIAWDDLGAGEGQPNAELFALTLGNEREMPAQIALSYPNMRADYNIATEFSDRLLSGQETTQTVNLAVGMTPALAKATVDAMLVDVMAGLGRATLRVPLKYARLEPGDVVTLTDPTARSYRLRIQSKRDALLVIELDVVLDDATALVSAGITDNTYALTENIRQLAGTAWEAMDIPLLRDADNAPGFYFAVSADKADPSDLWPGAVAVRSFGGDAFDQLFISGEDCSIGTTVGTLAGFAGGSARFDESTTLTVRLSNQLASTTRTNMLNDLGANMALVGSELLRFRQADLLGIVTGKYEYRLYGLLRGQRGTEQHIGTHGAGERFVLLTPAIRRVVGLTSEIGVASEVKAVTLNTLLSAVTAETFTDTGVSLKPFSVANLRCLRSAADLSLTWHRRTRLAYRYGGVPGVTVPLGEASEQYRVQVFDGATLVRTVTVTSPAYVYTSAAQTADGFVSLDPITFVIQQLSELVGPGFPATVEGIMP